MNKKVLVTGKNGQLGQSIKQLTTHYPLFTFNFVGREELDLSDDASIQSYFQKNSFDYIVNCAAYTAVDKAESDSELANQINHLAVEQLAQIAKQQDAVLIHISTDYVFNGEGFKPYIETDEVNPQGVYGATKLQGEAAIQAINPKGCIIRTSWVYSEFGNNFVKTMLRLGQERDELGVIFDQVGTPTYASDLAKTILQVIERSVIARSASDVAIYEAGTGLKVDRHATLAMTEGDGLTQKNEIFHFSNEGVCSWYDFAKTIFELSSIECKVKPIETKDYPTPAKRPHYSVLNKSKIKQHLNIEIPYWKDSLKKCLMNISEF